MHDAMTPYAVFHDWVPVSIALAGFFWGLYTYHRSTRLQLFQHRFAIYQSVQQVFKQSYEKSGLTKEELHNFRHATEHRDFLFGPKVGAYINTIMGAAVTVNRDSEELAVNQSRLVQLLTGPAEQSARDAVEESRRKLQAACQRLRVLLENQCNEIFYPYFRGFDGVPWYVRYQVWLEDRERKREQWQKEM